MLIRIGRKLYVETVNLIEGTLTTTRDKAAARNFYQKIADSTLALAKKLHKGDKVEMEFAPFARATGPRGPRKLASTSTKRRGRGRPPGSKNKTTIEDAPKRRGRPPGSKNKTNGDAPKRRGRPPGSKNKPK